MRALATTRKVQLILALAGPSASAETVPEFSVVDANGDGVLSRAEFQVALPKVTVTDANADGMLNQDDAERALPDLMFKANGFQSGKAFPGEAEYRHLLAVL